MTLAKRGRHWTAMATSSAVLTALTAALAGCGVQQTGIAIVGSAPSVVSAPSTPVTEDGIGQSQVTVYFLTGPTGTLVPIVRTISGSLDENAVIAQLLAGPTKTEQSDGVYSNLPEGLTATPNAQQLSYAYQLSEQLDPLARSQFICTMQANEQTNSIGYIYPPMKELVWVSCDNTTTQPLLLPGQPQPSASGDNSNSTAEAFAGQQ